jgi:hypothetical protein
MNNLLKQIEEKMNAKTTIKGGTNESEPYKTYKKTLNSIFDYYKTIFYAKTENEMKYKESVEELEKTCDCSKYQCKDGSEPILIEEGEENMLDESQEGEESYQPKEERDLLLKNEYIL